MLEITEYTGMTKLSKIWGGVLFFKKDVNPLITKRINKRIKNIINYILHWSC